MATKTKSIMEIWQRADILIIAVLFASNLLFMILYLIQIDRLEKKKEFEDRLIQSIMDLEDEVLKYRKREYSYQQLKNKLMFDGTATEVIRDDQQDAEA
jgi:hypothetical protein